MQLPDELLDVGLKPSEFYLLAVLYRNVDRWGEVNLTMDQLGELTGSSRTSLWRDMSGLEARGLVDTERQKRNLGRLHKNKYRLISPGFISETTEVDNNTHVELPCSNDETSTADYIASTTNLSSQSLVSKTSSYLEPEGLEKEKKLVNNWKEDDDVAGFGLLWGEAEQVVQSKNLSKKSSKNRHLRPQSEWTANDVASEFSKRLYQKISGVPAIVNTDKVRTIISKYRKEYGTTATVELAVMDLFFGDDRTFAKARREPHNAWLMFVRMLTTHSPQVTASAALDKDSEDEYIYASDGTKFDKSMPGRVELAEYEKSLQEAK
jgi:hypothetical protein